MNIGTSTLARFRVFAWIACILFGNMKGCPKLFCGSANLITLILNRTEIKSRKLVNQIELGNQIASDLALILSSIRISWVF